MIPRSPAQDAPGPQQPVWLLLSPVTCAKKMQPHQRLSHTAGRRHQQPRRFARNQQLMRDPGATIKSRSRHVLGINPSGQGLDSRSAYILN